MRDMRGVVVNRAGKTYNYFILKPPPSSPYTANNSHPTFSICTVPPRMRLTTLPFLVTSAGLVGASYTQPQSAPI